MADSAVAVTAGTGTNIDTRTEGTNGNHRQVIVIGDPATNAGVAPVDATAGLKVDLGADNDVTVTTSALPTGAATSAKQSDGSQKTQIVDGSGNVIGSTTNALDINIKSGNPTSITANAGTNLNTSALALESGGNLAAIKAKTDNIPALGQALAAGSVPVVLTASQLSTLTPPAAITGFATSAKQDTGNTSLASIDAKMVSGTDIGDVTVNNGSGVNAVNIQDGGNTITVDGTVSANATLSAETTKVIGTVNIAASQTVGLAAGTNAIGKLAANSGVDIGDVDITSIAAGNNNIGDVDIASIAAGTNLIGDVGVQPRTTNGLDTFMASGSDGSTALTSTAQAVKASAGKVYGYYIYNPNAAASYVHFYNVASASVTVGTTNPLFTLTIPATSAANLGITDMGVTFGTAISISATSAAGTNAAPSTALDAVIWYK